ncbi:MAG: PilZ domain-containing protein [candidate division NC10 bacterium]
MRRALRFRISGITEGIPTLQVAEVLDLSLGGAVVKHQRMFEPQRPCFLQLATTGNVSTIRCRIAHSRASGTGPDGEQYHQTMLEFRNPTAAAKKLLKTLIQSFGSHGGWEIAGP